MNEWASKWINEQASEQMSEGERTCPASNAELDWALRAIKKADKEMTLYSTLWLHSHSTYCEFSSGTTQPLLRVCTSMISTENLNDEVKALGCSIYFLSLHEFHDWLVPWRTHRDRMNWALCRYKPSSSQGKSMTVSTWKVIQCVYLIQQIICPSIRPSVRRSVCLDLFQNANTCTSETYTFANFTRSACKKRKKRERMVSFSLISLIAKSFTEKYHAIFRCF